MAYLSYGSICHILEAKIKRPRRKVSKTGLWNNECHYNGLFFLFKTNVIKGLFNKKSILCDQICWILTIDNSNNKSKQDHRKSVIKYL